MPLIHKLERKLGRFAITNLIQIYAGFLLLNYLLLMFNPDLIDMLHLQVSDVLGGQVWRLITFVLLPPNVHPVWILIYAMFLMFVGTLLEHAWGSFRVNVYFFWAAFCAAVFLVGLHFVIPPDFRSEGGLPLTFNMLCTEILISSLIIAACCEFPDQEIRLMMVIPIKMKWLGLIDGARVILLALDTPLPMFRTLAALFVMSGFVIVFLPRYIVYVRQRTESASRRRRYEENLRPVDEALHRCEACGKTEDDDPDLDFRVSGGEEYCLPCLDQKKAAESGAADGGES